MPLKINRLPNFNMLFQLVRTKFFKSELFSFFTESWSRDQLNADDLFSLQIVVQLLKYIKPCGANTTGQNQPLFRIYLRSWINIKDFVFRRSTYYGQEMEKI